MASWETAPPRSPAWRSAVMGLALAIRRTMKRMSVIPKNVGIISRSRRTMKRHMGDS